MLIHTLPWLNAIESWIDVYTTVGFIATDCGAVDFLNQGHYLTDSPPEAVAAAIRNGSDLEIGIPGPCAYLCLSLSLSLSLSVFLCLSVCSLLLELRGGRLIYCLLVTT